MPAMNASSRLPMVIHRNRSEQFVDQGEDRRAVGVANRSPRLLVALEGDQGRLGSRAEAADEVLLAVEIDDEIDEILELRIGAEFAQDRSLRFAGRTPRRVNRDQDRLSGLLRLAEGFGVECRSGFGESRSDGESAADQRGDQDRTARYHEAAPLLLCGPIWTTCGRPRAGAGRLPIMLAARDFVGNTCVTIPRAWIAMNVAGKIVVITGGGSGIGKAMGHAFQRAGAAQIVVADIDAAAADKGAAAIGGRAFACDVTDEAQIKSLIETVEREH